jgi:amidohydrolase
MKSPEEIRASLLAVLAAGADEVLALSSWMASAPELALEEHETSARYRRYLAARGFSLCEALADMPTAFAATWGDDDAPLRVALLAEMDALPGIGHACGHNLSGPASLLAAAGLAETLLPSAVRIGVLGCPAEETGVGKKRLVDAGVFGAYDVAMMAHASDMRRAHRLFLGNRKHEFVYHGRASHAAAYPERGVNALDGVIAFFVAVGLLRQQLPREARIHAIVSDGGRAPNVIPERAAARVWVRALDESVLDETERRVIACARGAAEATGTRLELLAGGSTSPSMKANLPLAAVYRRQLEALGLPETPHAPTDSIGSSDITHVSRVVPTIHPNFPIAPPGTKLELHTRAFAEATVSELGRAGLLEAARALALTVAELSGSQAVRDEVRDDFEGRGAD